jgi:hypothetical protein
MRASVSASSSRTGTRSRQAPRMGGSREVAITLFALALVATCGEVRAGEVTNPPLRPTVLRDGCTTSDVGPVTRQIPTTKGAGFGGPCHPTLTDKLLRRQVAERAVWAALIVVDPPGFALRLGVRDRRELVHIQTFIPQPSIKRFDERVFNTGLPGRMKSSCTPRRYAQSSSARD